MDGSGWKIVGGLALLGGAMAAVGTETGRAFVADLTKKGKRLTSTSLDGDGRVHVDPAELVRQAAQLVGRPVMPDAYAVARMVRSEEGTGPVAVKRYLAHVAINDAAALDWGLLQLMTFSTVASRKGYFGRQISRRYSTAQDPYEVDLAVAETVIDGRARGGIDPTAGATKFVNRTAFGSQAGASSYEAVRKKWIADGYQPLLMAAAPDLVFFRRVG